MAESWPEGVPYKPIVNTVKVAPFRAPNKTDLEDGGQRQRISTTKNIATVSFTLPMSNAEFATFKSFVRDTLVNGVLGFTMMIWTGAGYESRTCTFTQPYQDDPQRGNEHWLTLSLDVEDY